ncbi:trace amine-associated receptor 7c-like [Actinia tenebrosa]|uniref:Trace amine-associated receptor 7c-like n=1 Tax=Actinia tenebrosa TaxID=6105 RepID=A0A6P8I335_ACTTE|nr:trace amine-associated receptor 7c-like [Actinia tenebrosa]XP_031559240.1 trace amine-associated receptor 7c-like [Actinia tenebrosa]XP_031559243.1 trace amine-associated receptor 7c-like [Actinia tenebrosa]XP_031559244.1 trace amine-associated receptor 7c-like [Actinia tenebrosa]
MDPQDVNSSFLNFSFSTNTTTAANRSQVFTEFEYALIFVFLGVFAVLIILTNAFVIYLVKRMSYLQTSTNYSLASLACSDLLAGLVAIPLIILSAVTKKRGLFLAMDLSSRFICLSTILHLSSIALERYILIVHRMNTELMTKQSTLIVLPGIWIFSLTVTLIQMAWIDFDTPRLLTKKGMEKVEVIYDLCCIFILVFLPLLIIIYAYVRIYIIVRRQHNSVSRQEAHIDEALKKRKRRLKKEIRAVFIYGGMVLTFVLGWFYYFLGGLMHDLNVTENWLDTPPWLDIVLLFTRFATSLVNPLLYTFFKMDFLKAVRSLRKKIPCNSELCKKKPTADTFAIKILKEGKPQESNGYQLSSRIETSYTVINQIRKNSKSIDASESI